MVVHAQPFFGLCICLLPYAFACAGGVNDVNRSRLGLEGDVGNQEGDERKRFEQRGEKGGGSDVP